MNLVFGPHIGRILEVYIDNIIVKTREGEDPITDLEEVFQ
jgi:hypothetical protein